MGATGVWRNARVEAIPRMLCFLFLNPLLIRLTNRLLGFRNAIA